jgi:hypothetical protein
VISASHRQTKSQFSCPSQPPLTLLPPLFPPPTFSLLHSDSSNGYGIVLHPDGSLYAGTFVNSLRHGRGVQRWSDGHVYCGHWLNDVKHGQGSYRFSAIIGQRLEEPCDRYEGEWNNGCMHGRGLYYHKSGDVYDGNFENNEMSGHGCYMSADGTKIEGP